MSISFVHILEDIRCQSLSYTLRETEDVNLFRTHLGRQKMLISFVHISGDRRCPFLVTMIVVLTIGFEPVIVLYGQAGAKETLLSILYSCGHLQCTGKYFL